MKKTLIPGKSSSYQIQLFVTSDEHKKAQEKTLKSFQKDLALPGFRKGFVPLNLVEQHIQPEYLTLGAYESLTNTGLQELITENKEIRFIGEPYDFSHEKKGDETIITLTLDVFPEVKVTSEAWKKEMMKPITPDVTQAEIDDALLRLKKNYAEYKDTEKVALDTISKIDMEFLDKDRKNVETGKLYVGEPEFEEFSFFKKEFIGKKKGDVFVVVYKEKDFPPTVQAKKSDAKVHEVRFTVLDVKKIVLPELTQEMIEKLFGKDATVHTEADVIAYIKETLTQQKFEDLLVTTVEEYLKAIRGKSFDVEVPHTFVEEEFKVRYQNLEKRFGGEEKIKEYVTKLGDEKAKVFFQDIKSAAKESLEKFFILQKLAELLELVIDRNNQQPLLIEKKLYEKLTGASIEKVEDNVSPAKKTGVKKSVKK